MRRPSPALGRAGRADVADKAAYLYRGHRYAVRVTPDVAHWKRLSAVLTGTDEPSLDELQAALPVDEALEPTSEDGRTRRSVHKALESLQSARGRVVFRYPYGESSYGAILS